jgi:thiol-disulfide isomerase/thioredoxin
MRGRFETIIGAFLLVLLSAAAAWSSNDEPWQAPEFTALDVEGKVVSLSAHRGQVVVLHFWATWCTSCRREMPSLDEFATQYASRGVHVLTVTAENSRKKVIEFFGDRVPSYEVLLDKGSRITRLYRVSGIPVTLLIDRSGYVVKHLAGGQDWSSMQMRGEIERLLKE